MPIKTVLVTLNQIKRTQTLLDAARKLATDHDAHLLGVYVIPAVRVYPAMSVHVTPEIMDAQRNFYLQEANNAKTAFEHMVSANGLLGEWRQVDSATPNLADAVLEHAFQADMIVCSQANENDLDGVEADFVERLIMESGRPVLVMPFAGAFPDFGKNVMCGWNSTRESARAIFDALPLLERADTTRLVWVDPQSDPDRAGNIPGSEMAATLSRHGVDVIAEAMPTSGIGAGNALLNRAADIGADLLVMGAYGHSRMREFVFGGATRSLLGHMTLPTLLSH